MARYEYKVIPAPARAQKARGVRTPEGRFAHTIEAELNRMGAEGWEYLRAELLPHEERGTIRGTQTTWRTVLIFRRAQQAEAEALHPRLLDTPPPEPVPELPPLRPGAPDREDPPLRETPKVVPLPTRGDDEADSADKDDTQEDPPPRA